MPLKKYNTSSGLVSNNYSINKSIEFDTDQTKHKSPSPINRTISVTTTPQHQSITNHLYSLNDLLPNIIETAVNCSASASATGSASATVNTTQSQLNTSSSSSASSSSKSHDQIINNKLPNELKARLYEIFSQIEKEFDLLYTENMRLKQQIQFYSNNIQKENENDLLKKGTSLKNANTSMNTNSSSTSTLVANNTSNHNSIINKNAENIGNLCNDKKSTHSTTTTPNSSGKSSILSSKNRINNLSFPKFKPNAREFIMQSIKNTSAQIVNKTHNHNSLLNCKPQISLVGHKDGIWDVNSIQIPNYLFNKNLSIQNIQNLLIGTASADTTARLWFYNQHSINSSILNQLQSNFNQILSPQISQNIKTITNSICFQEYSGHTGSVNSIRFHPKFFTNSTNLILTSSGDCQAHIWQCVLPQHNDILDINNDLNLNYNNCYSYLTNTNSINDLNRSPSTLNPNNDLFSNPTVIRSPIKRYEGHQDACIAAEWFPDGELIATASWDRTANVYNVETGKILCNLQHDDYLTNVTIHKTFKILLTSSKDTTFKIWDFRDPICSVQIYQGHNRSVNSAIFVNDDKIATSSDDQTVKIWDLRIMRSPVCNINLNSGVNRICTMQMTNEFSSSIETYLCIPLDNRDIKIYNLQGERIIRLNRNNHDGHRRLVTSLSSCNNLLFSASFDKIINSWSFEYNPSKSSLLNNKINSNKENNENFTQLQSEITPQTCQINKNLEKIQRPTSPSILSQLSNLTSPSNPNSITAYKPSNGSTVKGVSHSSKLNEKIKI